ncbi:uncharacterized protein EKO05_0006284 [Ascochyta rabiei]|uniref:Catalytic n=1 Tax=Didymella rabiei TaxID=5454 RepID=A0A163AYB4_DIDRA|nr:uncharacterized protein EKO05_0006284 [Ascochyta rabiei]KZM21466.1 catalytic [Ascochyta rabiei]UPX15848.1 hypothetical protein EKO05_0006284 [Ascochyta rabiei]
MARSMRLFLIRHGETVDNVAQLYAGSRDSALTVHGYQQATRLGQHFRSLDLTLTHLFSSHLQRAAKTAGLVREAQLQPKGDAQSARPVPEVNQLRILMEQDFGDLEGRKWSEMQAELQTKPGFVGVETKEAMGLRADAFLDEHLLLLLEETAEGSDPVVAIVSHGIFLSTLWKRLLRRLPARSILLLPELQSTARPSLEHLGGWSNTGYLELHMTRDEAVKSSIADLVPSPTSKPDVSQPVKSKSHDNIGAVKAPQATMQEGTGEAGVSAVTVRDAVDARDTTLIASAPPAPSNTRVPGPHITCGWTTTILTINGKDHLKDLKRTGGGVGSSRHDASQQGIEHFFKRRKLD